MLTRNLGNTAALNQAWHDFADKLLDNALVCPNIAAYGWTDKKTDMKVKIGVLLSEFKRMFVSAGVFHPAALGLKNLYEFIEMVFIRSLKWKCLETKWERDEIVIYLLFVLSMKTVVGSLKAICLPNTPA